MKKHDRRTGIALLMCLLLSLQMCLPPSAVLAVDNGNQDGVTEPLQEITYTASGYSGEYDGNLHSISVSAPEGGQRELRYIPKW